MAQYSMRLFLNHNHSTHCAIILLTVPSFNSPCHTAYNCRGGLLALNQKSQRKIVHKGQKATGGKRLTLYLRPLSQEPLSTDILIHELKCLGPLKSTTLVVRAIEKQNLRYMGPHNQFANLLVTLGPQYPILISLGAPSPRTLGELTKFVFFRRPVCHLA